MSTDEKLRKKIKGNLMCVTPSGTFSQRQESDPIKHTGLLCIDIDFKDNPKEDGAKIATFFYLCKCFGIEYR